MRRPRGTDCGGSGVPSRWSVGEGHVGIEVLEHIDVGVPGVGEDGMPGRNEQRKPGTTRGSPRRSRTAKASRISRQAVKSRCAREWGRLSDDGPGHYNPDLSEGPWGRWSIPPHGGAVIASTDPTLGGSTLKHEGRRQTDRKYRSNEFKGLVRVCGRVPNFGLP